MTNDLKTPGFSIIILFGSIMTLGFFVVFFALLLKKRIKLESKTFTIVVFDVYGNRAQLRGIRTNFKNRVPSVRIGHRTVIEKGSHGIEHPVN